MWRTGSKKAIEYECIISFLKEASQYKRHEIILGTDSQPFSAGTFSVTAIAVLCENQDYHCRYFYKEHEEIPHHHNLYSRILSEAETTIKLATEVKERLNEANISIHLDVSHENTSNRTGRFSRSLVAMVKGYGYENVEIKPNAWCASKVADKHTKKIPSWLIRLKSD
jgi:predicted RNase H-related nuclease YkuK (DUF458 family)